MFPSRVLPISFGPESHHVYASHLCIPLTSLCLLSRVSASLVRSRLVSSRVRFSPVHPAHLAMSPPCICFPCWVPVQSCPTCTLLTCASCSSRYGSFLVLPAHLVRSLSGLSTCTLLTCASCSPRYFSSHTCLLPSLGPGPVSPLVYAFHLYVLLISLVSSLARPAHLVRTLSGGLPTCTLLTRTSARLAMSPPSHVCFPR